LSDSFSDEIDRVVFNHNTLLFDWTTGGEVVESVRLHSLDGISYRGTATNLLGTKWEHACPVEGVVYANAKGRILVAQSITPNDEDESWFIQFFDERPVQA
jgi:hypothetical protein